MGSQFGLAYAQVTSAKTADYTAVVADDVIPFTATTAALTATLYTPNGNYANGTAQGGRVRIVNNSTSTNIVNVATAAGSIVGSNLLYPGQSMEYLSDGVGTWFAASLLPGFGQQQITLSAANIIAMYTTPVQVIPTPGTGKIIRVDSIVGKLLYGTTQFASGGVFLVQYDSTANGAGINAGSGTIAAAILNASASQIFALNGAAYTGGALTGLSGKALYASNQTGVFASGDSTLILTVQYRVITP